MRVQVSALLTSEFTFAEQAGSLVRHLFELYPDAVPNTLRLVKRYVEPKLVVSADLLKDAMEAAQ